VRALGAAGHDPDAGQARVEPGRPGDHDLVDRGRRAQRVERPREQRPPPDDDERLGPVGSQALATAGGDEQGDGYCAATAFSFALSASSSSR
jgi:hypothetical protein